MAKPGRPPATNGQGLGTEIKTRVTPAEKQLFASAANAHRPVSMTLSAWIRMACALQAERDLGKLDRDRAERKGGR